MKTYILKLIVTYANFLVFNVLSRSPGNWSNNIDDTNFSKNQTLSSMSIQPGERYYSTISPPTINNSTPSISNEKLSNEKLALIFGGSFFGVLVIIAISIAVICPHRCCQPLQTLFQIIQAFQGGIVGNDLLQSFNRFFRNEALYLQNGPILVDHLHENINQQQETADEFVQQLKELDDVAQTLEEPQSVDQPPEEPQDVEQMLGDPQDVDQPPEEPPNVLYPYHNGYILEQNVNNNPLALEDNEFMIQEDDENINLFDLEVEYIPFDENGNIQQQLHFGEVAEQGDQLQPIIDMLQNAGIPLQNAFADVPQFFMPPPIDPIPEMQPNEVPEEMEVNGEVDSDFLD